MVLNSVISTVRYRYMEAMIATSKGGVLSQVSPWSKSETEVGIGNSEVGSRKWEVGIGKV